MLARQPHPDCGNSKVSSSGDGKMRHHGLKPNQNTKGVDKLSPASRAHLKQQRQEQPQSLRAISLKVALPRCGAQTDLHNKRKWLAPTGVLSVNGARFMNSNCGRGSGGAISLVIHLHHLDFKAAIDWLGRNFPDALSLPAAAPTAQLDLKLTVPAPSRSPTTLKKQRFREDDRVFASHSSRNRNVGLSRASAPIAPCIHELYADTTEHHQSQERSQAMARSNKRQRSRKVEAIKVHHLVPRRDKVVDELLLSVGTSVDFSHDAELGV